MPSVQPPERAQQRQPALSMRYNRFLRNSTGLFFVLPTVITMAIVIGYPLVYTFQLSVSEVTLGQGAIGFVGVDNFAEILSDRVFLTTLRNTLIWTVLSVFFIITLGLFAALTLNERFPFRGLSRSMILIPWIIPGIVAAVTWKWLYHPDFGVINQFLLWSGLMSTNANLLADVNRSLYAVILVNIWKSFPLAMMMLLAGLQSAPEENYDAARVDGANGWQRLLYITIPHLRPVLVVVALLMTIWNMNTFTYIYVLTGGGPVRLTEVFGVYIYNMAFQSFKFGLASATAVIVFVISTAFSVLYLQVLKNSEN